MLYWNTKLKLRNEAPFTEIIASLTQPTSENQQGRIVISTTQTTKKVYLEFLLKQHKSQLNETEWIAEFTSALYKYADVKVIGNVNDWRRIRVAIYDLDDAKGEDALDAIARQHNDPQIQTSTITWIAKAIIAWNNDNSYPFQRTNRDFQEYYHLIEAIATSSFKPIFNLINSEITRLEQADSGGDII